MGRQAGWLVGACAGLLLAGCNEVKSPVATRAGAPSLLEDGPLMRGAGANPNAPFALLEPARGLEKRPAIAGGFAAPCKAEQLSAYESGAEMNGDARRLRVALVNRGAEPCSLNGVPAVTLVGADGGPLARVAVEAGGGVEQVSTAGAAGATEVVLPAKGESEFSIAWTTGQAGMDGCSEVTAVAVAAPGTTRSFVMQHPLVVCGPRVTVSAVGGGAEL